LTLRELITLNIRYAMFARLRRCALTSRRVWNLTGWSLPAKKMIVEALDPRGFSATDAHREAVEGVRPASFTHSAAGDLQIMVERPNPTRPRRHFSSKSSVVRDARSALIVPFNEEEKKVFAGDCLFACLSGRTEFARSGSGEQLDGFVAECNYPARRRRRREGLFRTWRGDYYQARTADEPSHQRKGK
jgi:hypothetical protein